MKDIAHKVWQELQVPHCLRDSFTLLIRDWLEVNCKSVMSSKFMGIPWRILFSMGVWQLWLHRNNYVFWTGNVDQSTWKRCIQAYAKFFSIGLDTKIKNPKTIVPVRCDKPPVGWMKLNSDGSALGNPGRAGGGGLIHNHDGNWVQGYARGLGHTSSFMVELWVLRDGLILAREMRLNNLIIELDALSVVTLMNNDFDNLLMEPLLTDCRNLLKEIPNKRVIHIYREANQCVDALAN